MSHDTIGLMAVLVWPVLPSLCQLEIPGMGRGWDLVIAKGGLLGWLVRMMLSISESTLGAGCPVQKEDTEIIFRPPRLLYFHRKSQFEIDLPPPLTGGLCLILLGFKALFAMGFQVWRDLLC